jgi:hypothetical protein
MAPPEEGQEAGVSPLPVGVVQRAYEIARLGQVANVTDIAAQLEAERYANVNGHMQSASLRKDLRVLLAQAHRLGAGAVR